MSSIVRWILEGPGCSGRVQHGKENLGGSRRVWKCPAKKGGSGRVRELLRGSVMVWDGLVKGTVVGQKFFGGQIFWWSKIFWGKNYISIKGSGQSVALLS